VSANTSHSDTEDSDTDTQYIDSKKCMDGQVKRKVQSPIAVESLTKKKFTGKIEERENMHEGMHAKLLRS